MDTTNPANVTEKVNAWLSAFGAALERRDIDAAVSLFAPECYWRDLSPSPGTSRPLEGKDEIQAMLAATISAR